MSEITMIDPAFQGNPIEKEYARANTVGDVKDIPYDENVKSTVNLGNDPSMGLDEEETGGSNVGGGNVEQGKEAPKKTVTRKSSKALALKILKTYKFIMELGGQFGQIQEEELMKICENNGVDVSYLQLPIEVKGEEIPILEFIHEKNESIGQAFELDDKWVNETANLLAEVCYEKGWGLDPMQELVLELSFNTGRALITLFMSRYQIVKMVKSLKNVDPQLAQHYQSDNMNQEPIRHTTIDPTTVSTPKSEAKPKTPKPKSKPGRKPGRATKSKMPTISDAEIIAETNYDKAD